jgi:DNA uptake protein ComE-like DNA-binding protein
MRRFSVILAALAAGMLAAAADGVINLKKPEPDAFGNEPSTTVTPKPVVRINLMSEKDMTEHREIGPGHAKRVMAGRPYVGQDDFKTRSGLPETNYDKIKDVLDF